MFLLGHFLDSQGSGLFSGTYTRFVIVLLGIADVKHSVTSGTINKPLKILVQLDPLTSCSEVELSLSKRNLSPVEVLVEETVVFLLVFPACFTHFLWISGET